MTFEQENHSGAFTSSNLEICGLRHYHTLPLPGERLAPARSTWWPVWCYEQLMHLSIVAHLLVDEAAITRMWVSLQRHQRWWLRRKSDKTWVALSAVVLILRKHASSLRAVTSKGLSRVFLPWIEGWYLPRFLLPRAAAINRNFSFTKILHCCFRPLSLSISLDWLMSLLHVTNCDENETYAFTST